MSNCLGFAAFEQRFGVDVASDVLLRICEAPYNKQKDPSLIVTDVHAHDACNHTISGSLTHEAVDYFFVVSNGNWNGTEVLEFSCDGEVAPFEPPEPMQYMFVPRDPMLETKNPAMYGVYLAWKNEAWFQEKLRQYHYDKHFQPGLVTEQHYRDWARSKGLVIAPLVH